MELSYCCLVCKMLDDPLHGLLRLASNNFIAILRFRNLPTLWNSSTSSLQVDRINNFFFWGAQCNERHQRPTFCMPGPVMLHRDGQQELSTRALVTTIAYYSIGPLNLAMARRAASLDLSGSSVEWCGDVGTKRKLPFLCSCTKNS